MSTHTTVCVAYLQVLIVSEGFAVADLCLFASTEEPVTHLTEETRLWDQELHTCGSHTNASISPAGSSFSPSRRFRRTSWMEKVRTCRLTNGVAGVERREGAVCV